MFKLQFLLSFFLVVTAPALYGAEHVVDAVSTDSSGEMMVFKPGYLGSRSVILLDLNLQIRPIMRNQSFHPLRLLRL